MLVLGAIGLSACLRHARVDVVHTTSVEVHDHDHDHHHHHDHHD
jgi:hypothetical protein